MARALFEEGVSFADQAKWPEAVDRFRRAQSIKPTPGITFNLASALAHTGQVIEASELLEHLKRDPATPPELADECDRELAKISGQRAFLTLHVEGAPTQATVQLDGHDWPRAGWGVASPIDPGQHLMVGVEGGVEATRSTFELAPGERREVNLQWPTAAASHQPASSEADGSATPEQRKEKRPLYKSWVLWTCVGAVIAGGVVAGVLLSNGGEKTTEAPIPGNAGVVRW